MIIIIIMTIAATRADGDCERSRQTGSTESGGDRTPSLPAKNLPTKFC